MLDVHFDKPFDEQLDFFRQKGFELSPHGWRDVWQEAHARAFTVARVTEMDALRDIREALDRAMEQGIPLKQFKADLAETLERKGWFAPKGERAKVVMPDGTHRRQTSQTLYCRARGIGVPFDVLVATPQDLEVHKDNIGLIYRKILQEGVEVYAS